MIRYRREDLPAPLRALAWREDDRLVVVVSRCLGVKDARAAALAAIRKLPRRDRPGLPMITLPAALLAAKIRTHARGLVTSAAVTAAVAVAVAALGHEPAPSVVPGAPRPTQTVEPTAPALVSRPSSPLPSSTRVPREATSPARRPTKPAAPVSTTSPTPSMAEISPSPTVVGTALPSPTPSGTASVASCLVRLDLDVPVRHVHICVDPSGQGPLL